MKTRLFRIILTAAGAVFVLAGAFAWIAHRTSSSSRQNSGWVQVTEGPFSLWSSYEGELAARNVVILSSRFNGPATLTQIAPEGSFVQPGDVLARFDSFQAEQDLARLDREYAIAEAEANTLERAVLPLETKELETVLLEARVNLGSEEQILADSASLLADGLVSEQENAGQSLKVEGLQARIALLEMKGRLTEEHVHPARLNEARAKLDAAARQRESLREQLTHCIAVAPSEGEVVHLLLPLGGEMRTVRVGDVLYRNQEFLCLPDPSDWIVRCYIPENELSRVRPGLPARIVPRAYPGTTLTGSVETVSAMAQTRPLAPGQRFFAVTLRVQDAPPAMKSGLTVQVSLLSRHIERTVTIPRGSVRWEPSGPACRVRTATGTEWRSVQVGSGNAAEYEVLSGLAPGEWIQL